MQLKGERTIIFGNTKGKVASVEKILEFADDEDISQIVTLGRFDDNNCAIPSSMENGAQIVYNLLTDWSEASEDRIWLGILMRYDDISGFVREREYKKHLFNRKKPRMSHKHNNLLFAHYSTDPRGNTGIAEVFEKEIKAWEESPKESPLACFFSHSYAMGCWNDLPKGESPTYMYLRDEQDNALEIPLENGKQYWISTGPNRRLVFGDPYFANFAIYHPKEKRVTLRSILY